MTLFSSGHLSGFHNTTKMCKSSLSAFLSIIKLKVYAACYHQVAFLNQLLFLFFLQFILFCFVFKHQLFLVNKMSSGPFYVAGQLACISGVDPVPIRMCVFFLMGSVWKSFQPNWSQTRLYYAQCAF